LRAWEAETERLIDATARPGIDQVLSSRDIAGVTDRRNAPGALFGGMCSPG